ncbi:Sec1-like protein [Martensiomyces pterosporus]|nr:Sec1-like protein [Martensiomyces pterosporus]
MNEEPRLTDGGDSYKALSGGDSGSSVPIWKVLIFDAFCRDIVSTVLRVNDLRDNGVTVHMLLESERTSIPDVPAVYFVQPRPDSIRRIADDLAKDLYELYYVNFSSSLPRTLLEDFAVQTTASGTSHQIAQVYDQYLNFLCPEENMFSLHFPSTFEAIHSPSMTDTAMNALIDKVVNALFSVLLTQKTVPTICAPRGNAAEMIAARLDAKLREHILNSRHNLFAEGEEDAVSQSRRPILVLSYDLNVGDTFWASNAALPFPEVAINIDEESNAFKREADEITRMGGVSSLDEVNSLDMGASTKQLQKAITSLPELTARKAAIDMHMNIATALLDVIKDRQLDVFFQLEEQLGRQTKASVLEAVSDPEKKDPLDKLRLYILYLLANEQIRQADAEECEAALRSAGCDLAPLEYINKLRSLNKVASSVASPSVGGGIGGGSGGSSGGDLLGKFSSIGSRLTGLTDNSSIGSIFSGVRNLLPSHKQLPVTRIVEAAMSGRSSSGSGIGIGIRSGGGSGIGGGGSGAASRMFEDFVHFDPKQARRGNLAGSNASSLRGSSAHDGSAQEAIVFVVGGGNYIEYQNLMEFAQRSTPRKHIVYGSTDIVNPANFLEQLSRLNKAQS